MITHCIFLFNIHKKNTDNNLNAIPNANSIPIAYHLETSKSSELIKDCLYSTSLVMNAVNAYLFGDIY